MCIPPDFLFGFWWTLLSGPVGKLERWCDWKERPLFSQVQSPVTVVAGFLCFKVTCVFLNMLVVSSLCKQDCCFASQGLGVGEGVRGF